MLIFNILNILGYSHVSKINNYIYLGNINISQDKSFLEKNSIDVVVNCSKDIPFLTNKTKNYRIAVDDNLSHSSIIIMFRYLKNLIPIINHHLLNNKTILIHCRAGMQRSATFLSGLLMYNLKISKNKSIAMIKKKRKIAFLPYLNFNLAINEYETYLLNNSHLE
uniref:Tyrosine specific protein phosphatases domain-containing protein n=1 Tax=viral metagenome TaxID=1070528 RepID=A0A6C0IW15_9ZZZZ